MFEPYLTYFEHWYFSTKEYLLDLIERFIWGVIYYFRYGGFHRWLVFICVMTSVISIVWLVEKLTKWIKKWK